MEMEGTRRSFDRSREPPAGGPLKKPRLMDDQTNTNVGGRPFRATATTLPPSAARFRVINDREGDGGGAYHPQPAQPQQYHELVSQYKTALAELTFNSKPIITNLTIIAGESLHAAKAIAATVCANILEVPSDQKLPSLYLLDSIVKNIGRDYIKYFAARLPEVFCKAYRQVDNSVHASMRHLFGTWKGVFPPQALQMIEKELGFTSAVNGSSSSAATSRPDSQSRRSIHINPKILEIQHLQQSSRAKGMATDLTVPMNNSTVDVERSERSATIAAGRPWVDPPVKLHNIQRSQREILSGPGHEKKNGPTYGDSEYNLDISRSSGLGIGRNSGRVGNQGHEKPWYGAGNSGTETISGQKNGFSARQGLPNYSTAKSTNVDLHLQRAQSTLNKSDSAVSASWKNSEEEEFMWDMHSRISDQDAANLSINSKKDRWTPDGSEKLEFESQFRKPQSALEAMSRFDREASSDSQSTEQREQVSSGHISSPWQSRESHLTDGQSISGSSGISTVQADGYSATLGGLSSSSSLARKPIRPYTGVSGSGFSANTSPGLLGNLAQQRFQPAGAASPSGQSPMHQRPLSPSLPARYPNQQLQIAAERDLPISQSLSQPDHKLHKQTGSLKRLQNEESPASAPSQPSIKLNRQYPFSQPQQTESKQHEPSGQIQKPLLAPASKIGIPSTLGSSALDLPNLGAQTSGKSSTSSLLAEVLNSGILSNITTGSLPNKNFKDTVEVRSPSSIQPPLPSAPPPQYKSSGATTASVSPSLSDTDMLVSSNDSQKKEDQPPLPPGPPPSSVQLPSAVNKAANPISNLLNSLVAKGLISASKPETPSSLQPESPVQSQTQNPSSTKSSSKPTAPSVPASSTSLSSTKYEVSFPKPDAKSSEEVLQPSSAETKSLIGLEFKPDVIRELHPHVISALLDDLPYQCSICGLQLKLKERLDRHLEWHAWRKQEPDDLISVTRTWYAESGSWIDGKAGLPFGIESSVSMDEFERTVDEDETLVLADEDQCACILCGELFEDHYSQKRKKWMFKGAMHLTLSSKVGETGAENENAEGPIVHVNCVSESSVHDLELTSDAKMGRMGSVPQLRRDAMTNLQVDADQ